MIRDSLEFMLAFVFDFDLAGFDEWLDGLPDGPLKDDMTARRARVLEIIESWDGPTKINRQDDESQATIKRHLEFMLTQWRMDKYRAVVVPLAKMGRDHSQTQRDRANKRWAERAEVLEIISRLATRPEHRDDEPRDLWPHLYAELEAAQLSPEEHGHGVGKQYDYNGGSITYEAFRTQVNRVKKKQVGHAGHK